MGYRRRKLIEERGSQVTDQFMGIHARLNNGEELRTMK